MKSGRVGRRQGRTGSSRLGTASRKLTRLHPALSTNGKVRGLRAYGIRSGISAWPVFTKVTEERRQSGSVPPKKSRSDTR